MDALIGHTGFVGSNLMQQSTFHATFNSSNIADIAGRRFDRIVCAGVTAVKWWANQNPQEDLQRIQGLMQHLATVDTAQFTLISTVDVYDPPKGETEKDRPAMAVLHPYGRHRLMLEDFVAERFGRHSIVRLPALFGDHLKKNAIYDLMHGNRIHVINPQSCFQWYPLARLASDLDIVEKAALPLVNFATEPLAMQDIQERFFPAIHMGAEAQPPAHYDMRTCHAALFGGQGDYIMHRPAVMDAIAAFLGRAS